MTDYRQTPGLCLVGDTMFRYEMSVMFITVSMIVPLRDIPIIIWRSHLSGCDKQKVQ